MDPTAIAILVLVGALALEGLVLGLWVWHRGRLLSQSEYRECIAQQRIAHLERAARRRDTEDRIEEMTNAEAIADFDHREPVIFDDTGEG